MKSCRRDGLGRPRTSRNPDSAHRREERRVPGDSGVAPSPCLRSRASGVQTAEVPLASVAGGRSTRSPPPRAAYGEWSDVSVARRTRLMFSLPGPRRAKRRGDRASPDRRAREGSQRCHGRGRSRAREHRVRLWARRAPEGELQRARIDGGGRVLGPAATRRRRRHHALQFSGDGAAMDVPQRHRLREHLHPEAVGEGSVRRRRILVELFHEAGFPTGRPEPRARRQGRGRSPASSFRREGRELRRAPRRSRSTSTRPPRPRTESAFRALAGCEEPHGRACRMPISSSPPIPRFPPPTDRPGSVAWRSRSPWRSVTRPTRWSMPSPLA